jgi:hypothetical protein
MNLLKIALDNNAAIDVIERLAALQREERNYQAQVDFDDALNCCQKRLTRISADAQNPQTNSRYATYAKLDATVRPIYTAEGFSLSFGEQDCPTPGKTRFVGFLSRAGFTREYFKDMTPSTKGPKGNDVMTPIHADATADSYAKRYLLKNIFNLAIGEDDRDGNSAPAVEDAVSHRCAALANAPNLGELRRLYAEAFNDAKKTKDPQALVLYNRATNARKRELQ